MEQNVDIRVGAAKPFLQIEIQKGLRTINWEKTSNRLFNNFISPSHLVIHFYLRLRGCGTDFSDITWTIKRKTAGVINLIATDVYGENRYLCKGNKSWFEFKWNLLEEEKWFGEWERPLRVIKYISTQISLKQRTSSKKGQSIRIFSGSTFSRLHSQSRFPCLLSRCVMNKFFISQLIRFYYPTHHRQWIEISINF